MCIRDCAAGDFVCIAGCSRQLDENKQLCPCQESCPNGCPCPEYTCPDGPITTTTTTMTEMTTPPVPRNSVLIINTQSGKNAVVTNGRGSHETPGDFMFAFGDNTEAYWSCSITWQGDFYIFGGNKEKRQVSKMAASGCKLERIGDLDFDFNDGGCGNVNDEHVFLCFNSGQDKKCHIGNAPLGNFSAIVDSNHPHGHTRIGASPGCFYC